MNSNKRLKPENPTGAPLSTVLSSQRLPCSQFVARWKNAKCRKTEHCVSDVGIPNGEPFYIYITRMLVVEPIFVYADELRGIYLELPGDGQHL